MTRIMIYCILFFSASMVSSAAALELPKNLIAEPEALQALFSGKTAGAVKPVSDNQLLVRYFAADGRLHQVRDGFQKQGRWHIRKDGRLCTDFPGAEKDCRAIVRMRDGYGQVAIKLRGEHRHELTYVEFRSGNRLHKLSAQPVLPAGTLSRRELRDLFHNRTATSVSGSRERLSRTYYAPDGSVEQLRDGRKRTGKWRITRNARICLQMDNNREKCRIVVRESGELRKYVVKKNGRHQPVVTYRAFAAGKDFR